MCGIIGVISNKNSEDKVLEGLKRMEYRGYDSSGISVMSNNIIKTQKEEGKITNLENAIKKDQNFKMGFVRYSFLICFFALLVSPVMANECSKEDKDCADFGDNYYTPEDAYAFGLKVQSLVSNQDLSGIFSLVQGELRNGPRKAFVANKTFKEVFNEEWISEVLGDNPPRSPVGWRGFMLGNGLIWYDKGNDGWKIFSINGAALEIPDNPLLGWTINETIVHPFCFKRPLMSGEKCLINFEEFAKVSLVAQLEQCSPANFDFEDRNGAVWVKGSPDGCGVEYSYQIIGAISDNRCSDLAPNIGVNCNEGYLIGVGHYSGGSIGWDMSYGIYGFFDLPNFGPSIVPLKFFQNKNDGLNFLDEN